MSFQIEERDDRKFEAAKKNYQKFLKTTAKIIEEDIDLNLPTRSKQMKE